MSYPLLVTDLCVIPIAWAGAPVVGPGVSVFHARPADVDTAITAIMAGFAAVNNAIPSGLQITAPTGGDTISEETGQVTGVWAAPVHSPVGAIGSGTWVNGVGARVKWLTGAFRNGRAVVGSTFIVPLIATAYEGAGNITSANLTLLQAFGNAIAGSAHGVRVYSRKNATSVGTSNLIINYVAPDKVSWLRSRRT